MTMRAAATAFAATIQKKPTDRVGDDAIRGEASTWGEAPTWVVMAAIYGGWLLLTWFYEALPWWITVPAGAWLIAWHGSFQHEVVHGHPTGNERLNTALAIPPLALWLPYPLYRDNHRAHHRTESLTDPMADPESFYIPDARWRRLGPIRQALLTANNTVAGRLLLGPWIVVALFLRQESRALLSGDKKHIRIWGLHFLLCAMVLFWVSGICGISILGYVLGFVWPGLSLTLLRSFAEHRPAPDQSRRTAIVEAGPLLSLLYLNNNLHVVHHQRPDLPWHALPAFYRTRRNTLVTGNGGFLFSGGYAEIVRRYGFRLKDRPVHRL